MPLVKKRTKPLASKPTKAAAKKTPPTDVEEGPTGEKGTWTGYCVKCKEKGAQFDGEVHINAKGGRMAKGPHKKCGTTICRILGKNA